MIPRNLEIAVITIALLPLLVSARNVSQKQEANDTTTMNFSNKCMERNLDVRAILYTVLMVCVFIVALIGNGVGVTVIYLSKMLRKHPTNLLVASLNLCDIGVILCSIPLRLDQILYGRFCFDIHACRFFNVTDLLFHISSISHLFVIAIERCVAIRAPFFHRYTVSTKTVVQAIVITWVYSAIWTGVGMFDWENSSTASTAIITHDNSNERYCSLKNRSYHITVYIVTYLLPLAVMAVMYTLILRSAWKHNQRMSENTQAHSILQKPQAKGQEDNISKTVAIIYGTFVICWLPATVVTIIHQTCPQCWGQFQKGYPILSDFILTSFMIVLPAIHSCLNPFIYVIFHQSFRTAVQELIGVKSQSANTNSDCSKSSQVDTERCKLKTTENL